MHRVWMRIKGFTRGAATKLASDRRGFGLVEILGIAGVCIVVVFITIPGLRTFASNLTDGLQAWYGTHVAPVLFPTS